MGMGMEMGVEMEVGDGWMGPRSKTAAKGRLSLYDWHCVCVCESLCQCLGARIRATSICVNGRAKEENR